VERADGSKQWWIEGENLTQKEFEQMQKDKPTEINSDGIRFWKNADGKLHREDGPAIEYTDGSKSWYLNGELHREDGPAVEFASGARYWCLNGKYHREDGPAVEYSNGTGEWWVNGKKLTQKEFEQMQKDKPTEIDSDRNKYWKNADGLFHREDAPAIEWTNGIKSWYLNGNIHREDGPAIERPDGSKGWWINNKELTQEEFEQMQKNKPTRIDSDGNKYWENANGERHREDGPAVEWINGSKHWNINGQLHREDGPAIERFDGTKSWWINGKRHREDGPARVWASGTKEWWIDGKKQTQEELARKEEGHQPTDDSLTFNITTTLNNAVVEKLPEAAVSVAAKKAEADINKAALTSGMVVNHVFSKKKYVLISKNDDGWIVENEEGVHEVAIPGAVLRIYKDEDQPKTSTILPILFVLLITLLSLVYLGVKIGF